MRKRCRAYICYRCFISNKADFNEIVSVFPVIRKTQENAALDATEGDTVCQRGVMNNNFISEISDFKH